jgi:CRISPR/Cas system-associated protein endoribonuclease Cas2
MKLKKGSAEAKSFMAKIRAKKGTTKKVAAKKIAAKKTMSKHTDTKSHKVNIKVVSGIKKPIKTIKKNNKMGEISAYKIYWNVLMPIKGKLTKTDQVKINKFLGEKGVATKIYPYSFIDGILYTFSNKIDEYVNKIQSNNPLSKSLISYKFTDKQFGMSNPLKGDIKFGNKNYIVLTEKQKQESKFIK